MALHNFIGKRKWKAQFDAGQEAFNAGDLQAAEASLQAAMEHAIGISERDSSYGDTALLLGQVFRRLERNSEANEMCKKAFDYYESVFGVTDPRTVQAHLAIVLVKPSAAHENKDVRKATHELARSQFGDQSWQAIRTAAMALPSFSSQEREKILADAQNGCSDILGENRINLGTWPPVAEEFAVALRLQGYSDIATRFMGFQLRINEERYGDKSQEAALARLHLGELFLINGHPNKAEVAFSRSIDHLKLKVGPRSEPVQRATVALAQALVRQKKLAEAGPYLTEALTLLNPNQVEERLEVLGGLLELNCLIAGTDSKRGALWQELESLWERSPNHAFKARIFEALLAAQNRLQQAWELTSADRFLHAVLARIRKWRGPHHPDVARVMSEVSSCSIGLDDRTKATSFLDQSLALDEGLDNLIRAATLHARLGDREKSSTRANQAKQLLSSLGAGVEQARRQLLLSEALLLAGDTHGCMELAKAAEQQLPESEQVDSWKIQAQARVFEGDFEGAILLYKKSAPRLVDPYDRAHAFLQLAWILTQRAEYTEAKEALKETDVLLSLREDHPLAFQVKAVSSQIGFYAGNVYEGRELREAVLSFLKEGHHEQTMRALGILTLLEPFGAEEGQLELEVGTQILAATEFPDGSHSVFPTKDASLTGLRHVTRGLSLLEQRDLAKERLSQYKERFLQAYSKDSPLMNSYHRVAAVVAEDKEEKRKALGLAVPQIRALAPKHVVLFPTLLRLTELHVRSGDLGKAKACCDSALELRHSPKLAKWNESFERGVLPDLGVASEPSIEDSVDAPEVVEQEGPASLETDVVESVEPSIEDEPVTSALPDSPPIASSGPADLGELQLARFLSERAEAPSPEETVEFLNEVKARFGEEVQPNLEARLLLALLFADGATEASELWTDALTYIEPQDFSGLLTVENRARDASSWYLVVQTLKERLKRESDRYGENAVETLETQMRLARAYEVKGDLPRAYRRFTMIAEILRSWFGARSRRLLEPLAELIRVAESLNDVQAAFEHQLERHRLLEAADGDAEELFNSRISLLPIRGRMGQVAELLEEAHVCEQEVLGFRSSAASEFVKILLVTAKRVDQLHWRCDAAATLLEIALRVLPEQEVSTGCRVRIALAECQYRKDYRSQASRIREEAIEKAGSLDADARAQMLHLAAQSCLRIQEIEIARKLAERILEERIAESGRKDLWAGRALLVLAEADLRTFRLEGTETAIGMSAPSLKGTRFWGKAQALQLQALFFLNRFDEAYEILAEMPVERALDMELKLAVWRGKGAEYVSQLRSDESSLLAQRWTQFESAPLDQAVNTLEFFARAGQVALMGEGLQRIWGRATAVLNTDIRHARLKVLSACMQYWDADWDGTASTLQRTIELVPEASIEFPEGLTSNLIREALLTCFLMDGRSTSALAQAQQGVAEAAELLGEEDIRAMAFRVRMAQCAQALGQLDDALVILDEILTPMQEIVGETHVLLRDVFRGLATTFLHQEDVESARMSAEEALRIDKECRGLSIHFLEDLELLAEIEQTEDIPEAINLLDTALELGQEVLSREHSYFDRLRDKRRKLTSEEAEAAELIPQESPLSGQEDEDEPDAPRALHEEEEAGPETDSPDSLFGQEMEEPEESPEEPAQEDPVEFMEAPVTEVEEDVHPEPLEGWVEVDESEESEESEESVEVAESEESEESAEVAEADESESEELEEAVEVAEAEEAESEEAEESVEVAEAEEAESEEAEESVEVAEAEESEESEEPLEVAEAEESESEESEEPVEVAEADESESEESEESVEVAEADEAESEDSEEPVAVAEAEEAESEEAEEPEEVAEAEEAESEESEESVEVAEAEEAESEEAEEPEEVAEAEEAESEESEEPVEVAEAEEAESEEAEEPEEVAEAEEAESEESEEPVEVAEAEEAESEESEESVEVAEAEESPEYVEVPQTEDEEEYIEPPATEDEEAETDSADALFGEPEESGDTSEVLSDEQLAVEDEDEDEPEPEPVGTIDALFGEPEPEEQETAAEEPEEEDADAPLEVTSLFGEEEENEEEGQIAAFEQDIASEDAETTEQAQPEEEPIEAEEWAEPESSEEQPAVPVAEGTPFGQPEEEDSQESASEEDEEEAEAEAEFHFTPAPREEQKVEEPEEELPRPYKVSAKTAPSTPVATSKSVEFDSDFPEVPLRLPHISEVEEPVAEEVPVEPDEVTDEPQEESVEHSEAESDVESVSSPEPVSVEALLSVSDPESHMLPLAPVFFLPVPWKEATEASFDAKFEEQYQSFQSTFKKDAGWRPVVEEAVSEARLSPDHASGYFLFLLGAQLERGGHLHTADVCLATAIELLEEGPAFGAACHLAGRVAGRRGELTRALEYFDRSAELAGESEMAVLKIDAAECHLGMGRPEEALLGFEEVFDYLAETAPKVQALAIQAKMAQIHLLIGDPDTSQAMAEETKERLSPKNTGTYRVLGKILLSRAFARLGRHDLALELAEKAWEGAKPWSAKRKDGRRIAISNLTDIYCVVGRFSEASELVRESGLTGWGLAEAEVLLRAGHVACHDGDLLKARKYIHLGKSFLTRFQSPALWRSCFLELEADVFLREGEYARAAEIAEEALSVFEQEATGPVDRSRHIVRAAKIAGANGEIERAKDLMEQAHSLRDLHLGAEHPHTSSVEGLTAVLSPQ